VKILFEIGRISLESIHLEWASYSSLHATPTGLAPTLVASCCCLQCLYSYLLVVAYLSVVAQELWSLDSS